MKTQWTDLTNSTISNEEGWFRRFHDRYHNEAVVLQTGLINKSWANKLLLAYAILMNMLKCRMPI